MINNLIDEILGRGKNTPNKFTVTMGELIRNARKEIPLSQSELAKYVYVSQAAISDMENGKREVSTSEILSISYALGKPIIHFFPEDLIRDILPDGSSPIIQELIIQANKLSEDDIKRIVAQTRALVNISK